ncbi:MAG: PstS family phosphate ABC transporter substrate-binding protein [Pirellulaceae bacterium]
MVNWSRLRTSSLAVKNVASKALDLHSYSPTGLFLTSLAVLNLLGPSAFAQESKPADASVEQCMAMLQSIDPYPDQKDKVRAKVAVFGSTSMDALAHGWTFGFKRFHPEVKVEISAAGSEATFAEILKNPSGVGMLSRPVKEAELEMLKKEGLKQPVAFVVAREALGVFVHPSNPVRSISGEQLRVVFTAAENDQKPTWKLLGATGDLAAEPINVVSRTERSGTQKFLQDFVFAGSKMREGVSSHVSNAEVIKAISNAPLAIGICGLRSNHTSVRPLQLMAGASAVPSDGQAILSGQYPLTRPLTMIVDIGQQSAEAKAAQEFVRYGLCQAGQFQVVRVGFYPVDLPLLRAGLQKLGKVEMH